MRRARGYIAFSVVLVSILFILFGCARLFNKPPVADFTITPASGPAPLTVTFDASPSFDPDGRIVRYEWSNGGVPLGTGKIRTHTYTDPGHYEMTLTVYDDQNASDSITLPFTVTAHNSPPKAGAYISPTSGLAPLTVICDASGSFDPDAGGRIVSYTWDFGDGTTGTGVIITHTYVTAGAYIITLTVTDDQGATGTSVYGPIEVAAPSPHFSVGQLVLAYWGDTPRIGKILSCDQSDATIQFLRDAHETIPPSGYYPLSAASIYPLTSSQADIINWLSTWYYKIDLPKYPDTFDGLGSFLEDFVQLTSHYELNVYDCSQASAWLECALENSGFDAWIAVGPTPWAPSSEMHHAWVLVYLPNYSQCKMVVAIESTVFFPTLEDVLRKIGRALIGEYPGVIYDDDSDTAFRYYHPYDEKYDIYTTVFSYGIDDWNWWKVLEEKREIPPLIPNERR